MKEYIIKVDEPNERTWDGSRKVFETRELVRCKDCKHNSVGNWCNAHMEHYPDDEWFCADGERKET